MTLKYYFTVLILMEEIAIQKDNAASIRPGPINEGLDELYRL